MAVTVSGVERLEEVSDGVTVGEEDNEGGGSERERE